MWRREEGEIWKENPSCTWKGGNPLGLQLTEVAFLQKKYIPGYRLREDLEMLGQLRFLGEISPKEGAQIGRAADSSLGEGQQACWPDLG